MFTCIIFFWLNVHLFYYKKYMIVIPHSISSLFEMLKESARNAKIRKDYFLIWSIWKVRNCALFANGSFCPRKIIENIKVLSWKWMLARLKVHNVYFMSEFGIPEIPLFDSLWWFSLVVLWPGFFLFGSAVPGCLGLFLCFCCLYSLCIALFCSPVLLI
jgi:hypothetical protein